MEEEKIVNLSDFLYRTRYYICHYSQERAAKDIGISLTYYKDLENGKMTRKRTSYPVIEKIALWARKDPNYVNLLKKGRARTIDTDQKCTRFESFART